MFQSLVATSISGASAYTFRISGGGLGSPLTFISTNSWTSLGNFAVSNGTTYSVDVAPTINGTVYPYGSACNITTPPVPPVAFTSNEKPKGEIVEKSLAKGTFTFETVVYPNPSVDAFHVELTSDDTKTPILIAFYDAMGRMVQSQSIDLNEHKRSVWRKFPSRGLPSYHYTK
tara:strand:+ start:7081 stop:7599 length:519 start_codon:yes stop_codon:yes gene_type:complete